MSPPSKTFRSSPATIVIDRPTGDELWIGDVSWEAESDPAIIVTIHGYGEDRWFPCDSLEEVAPDMWKGVLWTDSAADGHSITIRPTVESDAISAVTMGGMPKVPMPLAVIAAIHASNGEFTVPNLYAMSEDDGFVSTMMLNTDDGLFVRYANAWHLLNDEDVVDGLSVHEVDDAALDMFDQFDRAGQLVHVSAMPHNGAELPPEMVQESDTAGSPAPMVSSGVRDVPMLASSDDLPAAIAAAVDNPDLQWWVERRCKALGIEADLPWA